jgi:hypothetical protein
MTDVTTPAAGGAAFDPKALQDAVAAGIAAGQKPLLERLGALELKLATPGGTAAGGAAAGATAAGGDAGSKDAKEKPLSAADVARLLDERDAKRSQASDLAQKRQSFVGEKLKDLPAAYQSLLGSDPAQWPAEEQRLRQQFQADFKVAGGKVADVGGGNAGGAPPAATVDMSKLSAVQKIALGLKTQGMPDRSGTAATAAAATGTAATAAT